SGARARVSDPALLAAFGVGASGGKWTVRDLWAAALEASSASAAAWRADVDTILQEGNLAERIVRACGVAPSRGRLRRVYAQLADCLEQGVPFRSSIPPKTSGRR